MKRGCGYFVRDGVSSSMEQTPERVEGAGPALPLERLLARVLCSLLREKYLTSFINYVRERLCV